MHIWSIEKWMNVLQYFLVRVWFLFCFFSNKLFSSCVSVCFFILCFLNGEAPLGYEKDMFSNPGRRQWFTVGLSGHADTFLCFLHPWFGCSLLEVCRNLWKLFPWYSLPFLQFSLSWRVVMPLQVPLLCSCTTSVSLLLKELEYVCVL